MAAIEGQNSMGSEDTLEKESDTRETNVQPSEDREPNQKEIEEELERLKQEEQKPVQSAENELDEEPQEQSKENEDGDFAWIRSFLDKYNIVPKDEQWTQKEHEIIRAELTRLIDTYYENDEMGKLEQINDLLLILEEETSKKVEFNHFTRHYLQLLEDCEMWEEYRREKAIHSLDKCTSQYEDIQTVKDQDIKNEEDNTDVQGQNKPINERNLKTEVGSWISELQGLDSSRDSLSRKRVIVRLATFFASLGIIVPVLGITYGGLGITIASLSLIDFASLSTAAIISVATLFMILSEI